MRATVKGRGLLLVYVAAVLAYGGFWCAFTYVPTQDGPAHLSSAVVFNSLLAGDAAFAGKYDLNLTAAPYWTYHAVMAPLLAAFRPLVAEKIFLFLYVALFAAAGWFATRAAAGKASALGLLSLVFATSFPFQMGFYNFMAGVPLFLLAASYYRAGRERGGGRFWIILNLLVTACYFSHLLAWGAAVLAIMVFAAWPAGPRGRVKSLCRAALYLVPSYVLPAYFLLTVPKGGDFGRHSVGWLVRELAFVRAPVSFGPWQEAISWALAATYAVLLVAAVVARLRGGRPVLRPGDAFAAAALVFVVAYFALPGEAPPGVYYISERMALFPFLLITPWLAANLPRGWGRPAAWAAVVLVLANLVPLGLYYARENEKLRIANSGYCVVAPGRFLLPMIKDPVARERRVESLRHVAAYYVIAADGCNLADMAAATSYFPIKFAAGVTPAAYVGTFSNLRVYDVEGSRPVPDYVISYNINPFIPATRPVFEHYRPVHFQGRLIIYERGRDGR
jgi:hypothetical protein